jgi:hypothetical protein
VSKIDKLIKIIEKYTSLIKPLINKSEVIDRHGNLELFIKAIFLERFYYISKAIELLLGLYKVDLNYKLPLGVILRTGLSDFMTFFYIILIIEEQYPDVDSIDMEIKKFLAGNIQYLKNEIEWNLQEKEISPKQYEEAWGNIRKLYFDFFEQDTGKIIEHKNISISKIKKKLGSNVKFKWASDAYNAYEIFSKYEHIGALTYDLQKVHLKSVDFDTNGIIGSTTYIYWGVEAIVKTLPEYTELKKSFTEINKDWLNI